MSLDHQTIRELLPGLALGVLEPEERAALAEHLPACSACRAELAGYRQSVLALLEAVPPIQPPSHLRQEILQRARTGRRPASSGRWPLWAAAALVLLVTTAGMGLELRQAEARLVRFESWLEDQSTAVAVLQDPEVQRMDLQGEGMASGARAVVFIADSRAALALEDMPPPPEGMIYQAWLVQDGRRDSAGTFGVGPSGSGLYVLEAPQDMAVYAWLGVTLEPMPGSPGPTGERVLGLRLR